MVINKKHHFGVRWAYSKQVKFDLQEIFARVLLVTAMLLIGMNVASTTQTATAAEYDNLVDGVDYIAVSPAQPVRVAKKEIEVIEFFNYSCPHCNRLQPQLKRWLATIADDVKLTHAPVPFERSRGLYAQIYFTIKALDDDSLSGKLYKAMHQERKLINSENRAIDFLAEETGKDANKIAEIFNSFSVATSAARASAFTSNYQVNSTPQLVVHGKYRLNVQLSGSYSRMFEVIDLLIAKERAALSSTSSNS